MMLRDIVTMKLQMYARSAYRLNLRTWYDGSNFIHFYTANPGKAIYDKELRYGHSMSTKLVLIDSLYGTTSY